MSSAEHLLENSLKRRRYGQKLYGSRLFHADIKAFGTAGHVWLEKRSERVFTLKEGTLYPLLHALEQEGAVICEQRTSENGRGRKYYIITDNGRRLLNEKLKEWDSFQTAVNQVIGGVLFG